MQTWSRLYYNIHIYDDNRVCYYPLHLKQNTYIYIALVNY